MLRAKKYILCVGTALLIFANVLTHANDWKKYTADGGQEQDYVYLTIDNSTNQDIVINYYFEYKRQFPKTETIHPNTKVTYDAIRIGAGNKNTLDGYFTINECKQPIESVRVDYKTKCLNYLGDLYEGYIAVYNKEKDATWNTNDTCSITTEELGIRCQLKITWVKCDVIN